MSGILLTSYLRSLHTRKVSPETLRTARSVLGIVESYTGKALEHCTPADLRAWQERRADELSARSLRTQVSYVQNAYRWAVKNDHVRVDPSDLLEPPKVARGLPRPIPDSRLAGVWDVADDRMRVILALGAFAGLRACEVARLDWADVYLDEPEPYLRVLGKGSKERALDVSPLLADVLQALPGPRRGPVVRRADGKAGHNTPVRISKLANTFLHEHGVPDTFHATRHRFLTVLCRFAGIRVAQEAAGHSTPSPTAIYTRVGREDMRPGVVRAGQFFPEAS